MTKYRLINKSDNKVMTATTAMAVSIYLLGRNISNYIVIKSDLNGDRIVAFSSNEYNALISSMESA